MALSSSKDLGEGGSMALETPMEEAPQENHTSTAASDLEVAGIGCLEVHQPSRADFL